MIFHIAMKDLLITFKDKKALAIMLLMPILIILILGSALGNMFAQSASVDTFTLGVVNADQGARSQEFIHYLTENGGKMFETRLVDDQEAQKLLKKKKVPSVIRIPADFSTGIENGKPVKITVESLADDNFKSRIVESFTEGYAQGASNIGAGLQSVMETAGKNHLPYPPEQVLGDLQQRLNTQLIQFTEKEQEKTKMVTALQYYAAGMLLMFILFGANMGTRLMVEERETKTLGRILTTHVGKFSLITGKFLGLFFICLVQASILVLFTALAYGVNWGSSIPVIILVTLSSVFAGAAMGMFIAAIAKTSKSADGLGQIFIQMSTIVGGGMIPIYVLPEFLKQLAKITVNYWGTKGYLENMMGTAMGTIIPYCGLLILMGILYLSIGIFRFRAE